MTASARPPPTASATHSPTPSDVPLDAMTIDHAAATAECCPSGRSCEPGTCTDALEPDEGWHLRLAEVPKNGEKPLSETHPNAEVCVKPSDVARWTCTPVRELVDGGAPSSKLYVTSLDLTLKGIDVLVRFTLSDQVQPTLARTSKLTLPGASRIVLCKGLEVEMRERNLAIQSVRFYLDDDTTDLAPQRVVCP